MNKNSFLKSSAILFIGDLLTKILGFVYLAPLARIDSSIGTIQGFLMTPYSFFIIFSIMGITNVMMYKLGPVSDNKDLFKEYFLDGAWYVLITSTLITAILIYFSKPLMIEVTPTDITYLPQLVNSLKIIAISILFFAGNTLMRAVLLSRNKVTIISVTYITEQLVKILILLFGCYYYISLKGMSPAISSYVTAFSVILSVASTTIILLAYSIKIKLFEFMDGAKYKWKFSSFKSIFLLGVVYFVNSIFLSGFNQIDLMMLSDSLMNKGYSLGSIENITGIYFTWSWKLIMVVITTGSVFITMMIQQMTIAKDIAQKVNVFKEVFNFVVLYSILATIFFLTAGSDFYQWFYGDDSGTRILMIQTLLILPIMIRMQLSIFSITVGKSKNVLISTIMIFILKIILNPIMFRLFEVNGFIYASILSIILSIAFMLALDYKIFSYTASEVKNMLNLFMKMLLLYVISFEGSKLVHTLGLPHIANLFIISILILVIFCLFNLKALKELKKMI